MTTTTTGAAAAARELGAILRGQVVLPTDVGYDGVRRVWNGAVDRRPDVVARCRTPADVRTAVLAARMHHLPMTSAAVATTGPAAACGTVAC